MSRAASTVLTWPATSADLASQPLQNSSEFSLPSATSSGVSGSGSAAIQASSSVVGQAVDRGGVTGAARVEADDVVRRQQRGGEVAVGLLGEVGAAGTGAARVHDERADPVAARLAPLHGQLDRARARVLVVDGHVDGAALVVAAGGPGDLLVVEVLEGPGVRLPRRGVAGRRLGVRRLVAIVARQHDDADPDGSRHDQRPDHCDRDDQLLAHRSTPLRRTLGIAQRCGALSATIMDSSAKATGTLNSSICSRAPKIHPMRRRLSSGDDRRGDLLDLVADLLVDQCSRRTGRDRDGVAVDRHQVGQPAVDDVEVAALGAGALPLLERGERRAVLPWPASPLDHAVRRVEVGLLAGVELGGDRVGLVLGRRGEPGRGVHAPSERRQPGGHGDDLLPPGADRLVERQRPGPADVALARAGGVRRQPLLDAAGDQEAGDLRGGRRGQGHQPAAGPDRRQHVLDGRCAEHPHGAAVRLLDRLEQRVASLLGEPVGVLDDEDLPAVAHRAERRPADQVAHLVDADRELLGADHRHVCVGPREHGVAGVAAVRAVGSDAALRALQRRGERDCGVAAARARRTGEQPGMGHPVARHGPLQEVDGRPLADEGAPDAGGHPRTARSSRGATRALIAAARSSIESLASSTR